MKTNKDYYNEIDRRLKAFEHGSMNRSSELSKVGDKIVWCYKFKKITEKQMNELCDRVTNLFNNKILEW